MKHAKRLQDRVVLISGSSRGIGRETARLFAEDGCKVMLNGRDEGRLAETLAVFQRAGYEVSSHAGDVSDPADAAALVRACIDTFGEIDVVINNAGMSMRGNFADLSPSVVEAVVRSNVLGSSYLAREALPALKRSSGSLVFVSSVAGMRGFPGVSIYSAAKMALTALAQALDAELRRDRVHVGIVHIGFTQNDPDKKIYGADGSLITLHREHAHTQRSVAEAFVRCVLRRRHRVVLGASGHLLSVLDRLFPGLTRAVIARSGGRIHQMDGR